MMCPSWDQVMEASSDFAHKLLSTNGIMQQPSHEYAFSIFMRQQRDVIGKNVGGVAYRYMQCWRNIKYDEAGTVLPCGLVVIMYFLFCEGVVAVVVTWLHGRGWGEGGMGGGALIAQE